MSAPQPVKATDADEKKAYVLAELFETEKNVVRVLELICRSYYQSIRDLVSGEDCRLLFDIAQVQSGPQGLGPGGGGGGGGPLCSAWNECCVLSSSDTLPSAPEPAGRAGALSGQQARHRPCGRDSALPESAFWLPAVRPVRCEASLGHREGTRQSARTLCRCPHPLLTSRAGKDAADSRRDGAGPADSAAKLGSLREEVPSERPAQRAHPESAQVSSAHEGEWLLPPCRPPPHSPRTLPLLQELLKCAKKQAMPSQSEVSNLQIVIDQLEVSGVRVCM